MGLAITGIPFSIRTTGRCRHSRARLVPYQITGARVPYEVKRIVSFQAFVRKVAV